ITAGGACMGIWGTRKAAGPISWLRRPIFRYVEKRDSVRRKFETTEEQALVQWKEVLKDLRVEVVYVLSPAAKGKGERPYEWLQDHLVRTCVREGHHQVRSSSSAPL